ncbi:hypothetical protein [Devosia sp. MC521]|uniref:hypothetical protein n=1 Tax=Devosia sp. MC521 TaxID=2759954 RepID=UPI0015FDAB12|nr:hypothetical protein [Devosia sp. MC521]MBJ6987284.1 hypothetical protein [Devosia sp. MC521]QMW62892.1 hypothetical protein H4N61_00525 [Devosia sp. MC521]
MWIKNKYEKAFATKDGTHQLIYGNRTEIANVLGDDKFLKAWFASDHFDSVASVIGTEALRGDIPSIKQMIWLNEQVYQNAPNVTRSEAEKVSLQVHASKERIRFCEMAIAKGLDDRSYQAMGSYHNLYVLLGGQPGSAFSKGVTEAVEGIIRHAKIYLGSKNADPEYLDDVREALAYYSNISALHRAAL